MCIICFHTSLYFMVSIIRFSFFLPFFWINVWTVKICSFKSFVTNDELALAPSDEETDTEAQQSFQRHDTGRTLFMNKWIWMYVNVKYKFYYCEEKRMYFGIVITIAREISVLVRSYANATLCWILIRIIVSFARSVAAAKKPIPKQ